MPIIHVLHKGLEASLSQLDEDKAIYAINEADSAHIYTVLMALHEVETLDELMNIPAVKQAQKSNIQNATAFYCNVTINGAETIGAIVFETIDGTTVTKANLQTQLSDSVTIEPNGIYHINVDFERHY